MITSNYSFGVQLERKYEGSKTEKLSYRSYIWIYNGKKYLLRYSKKSITPHIPKSCGNLDGIVFVLTDCGRWNILGIEAFSKKTLGPLNATRDISELV